ncbi:hypothetical protein Lste_0677 [Legionella steelei]|uniref:Uncharacterized protein n=2 Tax=Legionellaceae TaxID=444 RepID=A0A0W0ZMD1_9GAMM|nr:hypothetical protein Lste_0677 [Legionella steelei]
MASIMTHILIFNKESKKEKDKDMNPTQYSVQETRAKDVSIKINQQEFEVKGVCKSFLFTSSSLYKHKRKQPS